MTAMKKILALGVFFALFTVAASAQRNETGLRDKQRIHRGFESGQLTRGERFKLHQNDRQYNRTERRFKHDGKLNRYEKKRLNKMKRHDRHQTFRYKHNRRHRVI